MSTVLRDERGKAYGLHGVFQIRFILRRNSDDMDLRERLLDVLRGLNAIFARHFHVHNNDVRRESKGQVNGFVPVCGLTHDRQALVAEKKAADGLSKGNKIVDDENAKQFLDARCS